VLLTFTIVQLLNCASQDWEGVLAAAKGGAIARVLVPSFGVNKALAAKVPALEDAWEDVAQVWRTNIILIFQTSVLVALSADMFKCVRTINEMKKGK
jgi:hypothetical protein